MQMKATRFKMSKKRNRIISMFLTMSMIFSIIMATPFDTSANGSLNSSYGRKQYVLYATGENALQLNTSDTYINGNIYTGGNLDAFSENVIVDGKSELVGQLNKHEHTAFNALQHEYSIEPLEYPHFTQEIMYSLGNNYQSYQWWHGIHGTDVSNDSSIHVQNGGFQITGSTITVQDTIIADNSILISGSSALNTAEGKEVNLYVPNGNIGIYVGSIDINGVIYAPNGTVQICSTDININGVIIAKEIMISAENVTINENYNLSLAEYIMTGIVEPFKSDGVYEDLNYWIEGVSPYQTITIDGVSHSNYNKNIVIPNEIYGIPVTRISGAAFACTEITSVTVPDSVKSIGVRAFAYCDDLETVNFISETPPELNDEVFLSTKLISETLPDLDNLEKKDLLGIILLETVTIPYGSMSAYRAVPQLRHYDYIQTINENAVSCYKCEQLICECDFCYGCGSIEECYCVLCETCGSILDECTCCNDCIEGNHGFYSNGMWFCEADYEDSDFESHLAVYDVGSGDVDGNGFITINDAIEILLYLVKIEGSIIKSFNTFPNNILPKTPIINQPSFHAARITDITVGSEPTIHDFLEILQWLIKMPSRLDKRWGVKDESYTWPLENRNFPLTCGFGCWEIGCGFFPYCPRPWRTVAPHIGLDIGPVMRLDGNNNLVYDGNGNVIIDVPISGQNIRAIRAGKVVEAKWRGDFGISVKIDHDGSGYFSYYNHIRDKSLKVSEGDYVKRNTLNNSTNIIGLVGATGATGGNPHLCFEIWKGNQPINPLNIVRP